MKQQEMVKQIMYVIKPHSMIDVITNSSSELFIFQGNDKEVVEEMIKNIYPNYRSEYAELQSIDDLTAYDMSNFLDTMCIKSDWNRPDWSYRCIAPPGMDLADITVFDEDDQSWYKDSLKFSDEKIAVNLDKIKKAFAGTYLLYSLDDNPDWEMQEALWTIGERHHLG